MHRRVAGNVLWMLADRGLQVVVGIGVVAMLARALGPEGFAHFQYAQSIVLIASSFALLCGAEVVVPRLVASPAPADQHQILAHAFFLRLCGGIAGYLAMCAYLAKTSPVEEVWHAALWLGVAIVLREPFGVVTAWMQVHTNNRPGTLISLVGLMTKAVVIGTLFALGSHEIAAYAAGTALEATLLATLLTTLYFWRVGERRVRWQMRQTRELIAAGALFWLSFVLMMGARRIDQLVLQPAVSAIEFGAYAACMQMLDNFSMIATILVAGIAPSYVYSREKYSDAHANIGRISIGIGSLGVLGAALIAAFAPWIVLLLYGNAFHATVMLLRVGAVLSALVFVDVSLTVLAIHMRRPRWVAIKWAAVLVTTLCVDLILIPRYGNWGAIAGYASGNIVAVAIGLVIWWRNRPVSQLAVL